MPCKKSDCSLPCKRSFLFRKQSDTDVQQNLLADHTKTLVLSSLWCWGDVCFEWYVCMQKLWVICVQKATLRPVHLQHPARQDNPPAKLCRILVYWICTRLRGGIYILGCTLKLARQFCTTPPNILSVGILLGWPFKTSNVLGSIPTVAIPNPGQPPLAIFLTPFIFSTKNKCSFTSKIYVLGFCWDDHLNHDQTLKKWKCCIYNIKLFKMVETQKRHVCTYILDDSVPWPHMAF